MSNKLINAQMPISPRQMTPKRLKEISDEMLDPNAAFARSHWRYVEIIRDLLAHIAHLLTPVEEGEVGTLIRELTKHYSDYGRRTIDLIQRQAAQLSEAKAEALELRSRRMSENDGWKVADDLKGKLEAELSDLRVKLEDAQREVREWISSHKTKEAALSSTQGKLEEAEQAMKSEIAAAYRAGWFERGRSLTNADIQSLDLEHATQRLAALSSTSKG